MKPSHVLDAFGVLLMLAAIFFGFTAGWMLLAGNVNALTLGRWTTFLALFGGSLLQAALLFGFADVLKHLAKLQAGLETLNRRL